MALPAIYVSVLCGAGLKVALREGALVGCLFPVAAAIMHLAYAVGFVRGLVHSVIARAARAATAKGCSHESQV